MMGDESAANRERIGVDLTAMPANAQVDERKRVQWSVLRGLRRYFRFYFLTSTSNHEECCQLLEPDDIILCVRQSREMPLKKLSKNLLNEGAPSILKSSLRRHGVQVLYAPFGVDRYFPDCLPVISFVGDFLHGDSPHSFEGEELDWKKRCFEYLMKRASSFQTFSDYTALQISGFVGQRPVVKTSPALSRFDPSDAESSKARSAFIYPADFKGYNNHGILFVAYNLYCKSMGEKAWTLIVVSQNDRLSDEFQSFIEEIPKIEFQWLQSWTELDSAYSRASCLVYPSLYQGCAVPLYRAMCHGIPIICGRDGCLPEIAGDAAFYVEGRSAEELAQAMIRMTKDIKLRDDLGAVGLERIRSIDFKSQIDQLAALIKTTSQKPRLNWVKTFFWTIYWDAWFYGRAIARKLLWALKI
jgi:glycosyltransferase involved in cell wall biosynthesis